MKYRGRGRVPLRRKAGYRTVAREEPVVNQVLSAVRNAAAEGESPSRSGRIDDTSINLGVELLGSPWLGAFSAMIVANGWVTLKGGQHVFIDGAGNLLPSGQPHQEDTKSPTSTTTASEPTASGGISVEKYHAIVDKLKKEWDYRGEVRVDPGKGYEFSAGGTRWLAYGAYNFKDDTITMYSGHPAVTEATLHRFLSHEMMHGVRETVYKQYKIEENAIWDLPDNSSVLYPNGAARPEAAKDYPTFARMNKFEDDNPTRDHLKKEDGITDYSKAYWKDYTTGRGTFHIAVHETLAEMAAEKESSGSAVSGRQRAVASPLYERFYNALHDEYKVLKGVQAQRRKTHMDDPIANAEGSGGRRKPPSEPLYTDHKMYLDADMNPTSEANAVFIRWWMADGSSGFATRVDREVPNG